MTNQSSLILGLTTLVGSLAIGYSMERSGVRGLSSGQRQDFSVVKRDTRIFRSIALGLLATYVMARLAFRHASPDWNHGSVLALWTSYNIVLWIKMRRVMKALQRDALPVHFQISYLFSEIISYTGLVSSMLVLLRGRML